MEAETCQLTTGPVSVNVDYDNGTALHSTLGSRKGCERATRWVETRDMGQRVASTSDAQDPTTGRIFMYAPRMSCSDLDLQGISKLRFSLSGLGYTGGRIQTSENLPSTH